MKSFLACGSVFEPFMGALFSTIICLGLLIFLAVRFFKGEKYREFKNSDIMDKSFGVILYIIVGSIVLAFLWFVLFIIFTMIVVWYIKNF